MDNVGLKAATAVAVQPATDETKKADETAAKAPDVGKMATLLAGVFALAAVIEAALGVVFGWPVFLDWINRRNSKMPIALLVSGVVAWGFDLRLIHKLAAAFGAGSGQNLPLWFDALLSALILAGGAAGVRNLMVSLGLATPAAELDRPPRPPSNKAWLSVRDGREQTERSSALMIWLRAKDAAGQAVTPPRLIGRMEAQNRARTRLNVLFLTDRSRFPMVAGYAVGVGMVYDIYVEDNNATPTANPIWSGVAFGEGAIIDLVYDSGMRTPEPTAPLAPAQ